MFSLPRIRQHLQRMILILGPVVLATVIIGLLLSNWLGQAVENNPLTHAAMAVIIMLPALVALAAIPLIASHFLRELYYANTLEDTHSFLSRIIFGPWAFGPYLKIEGGKIVLGEGSITHKVGGPGFLIIYHDSAVVTEKCGKLYRVLGTGFPTLEPYEKVWEIIDLRPQRWEYKVNAMTREGIPIACDAVVKFKIDDRVPDEHGRLQAKQPTDDEPHPYTPEAVFRAATSRWVRPPGWQGRPHDWAGRVVISFTEGGLRTILAEYRLDQLIAPTEPDAEPPREEIRRRLEEQLRAKVHKVGAKILNVDLGEIRVQHETITKQWLSAWQAEWESYALDTRLEGEAQLLRLDVAQAQAQAEMVITLTEALQSVASTEVELRPYLLATRFVQAMRWMSYDPYTRAFMAPEAIKTLKQIQDTLDPDNLLQDGMAQEPPGGQA